MPYIQNGNVGIYYEVEGKGPPLVMLHGLLSSLEDYKETGFVDALKDDFQIILMDLRGHGKSDKPHNPEKYAIENIVGDVTTVMDSLGIETASFFGYSYGGGIAFELVRYAPERVKALVVGGSGPKKPSPEFYEGLLKSVETMMDGLASRLEQGSVISPGDARFLANDLEAIGAMCQAVGSSPSLMEDVPGMDIPVLLFAGEMDTGFPDVREASELLPDVTFIPLPGLDHMQAGSRPELVVPHIKKFLALVNLSH